MTKILPPIRRALMWTPLPANPACAQTFLSYFAHLPKPTHTRWQNYPRLLLYTHQALLLDPSVDELVVRLEAHQFRDLAGRHLSSEPQRSALQYINASPSPYKRQAPLTTYPSSQLRDMDSTPQTVAQAVQAAAQAAASQSSPVPVQAPQTTSTSTIDNLTCQWQGCGERCDNAEALYVRPSSSRTLRYTHTDHTASHRTTSASDTSVARAPTTST
jgi:hypothetical protein